jgi:hypothetical protein
MDNLDPQATPEPVSADLQDQHDSLQYLVTSMLGLLTLLAGIMAAFLQRQQSDKGFDLGNFSIQANNFIAQYQQGPGRAQQDFLRRLIEYSRAHPDFAPILTRYGIKPAAASPIVLPETSTPAAQKK